MKPKLIVVAGCSGSGKTTIANMILEKVGSKKAQIICLDSFYLGKKHLKPFLDGRYNFDTPNSLDWKMLQKCLTDLLNNKSTKIPIYDYNISERTNKTILVKPSSLIILEGTMPLHSDFVKNKASLKIYVDTPLDECFIRRLKRDVKQRARIIDSVVFDWQNMVRPMHYQYVKPQSEAADIILPWNRTNTNGIDVLWNAFNYIYKD